MVWSCPPLPVLEEAVIGNHLGYLSYNSTMISNFKKTGSNVLPVLIV
jgi:hypothetical protein